MKNSCLSQKGTPYYCTFHLIEILFTLYCIGFLEIGLGYEISYPDKPSGHLGVIVPCFHRFRAPGQKAN